MNSQSLCLFWAATDSLSLVLLLNPTGSVAQIADVFGYAHHNISGMCVRTTVVPELSRVTISCRLQEQELMSLQKRLRALVCVTFFHITTMRSCIENNELLLRTQTLLKTKVQDAQQLAQLTAILDAFQAEIVFGEDHAVLPDEGASMQLTDERVYDRAVHQEMDISEPLFVHLADEPTRIDEFIATLRGKSFPVIEVQSCGTLFLDTSQSTLDPANRPDTFTREVAAEVEKLLLIPEKDDGASAEIEQAKLESAQTEDDSWNQEPSIENKQQATDARRPAPSTTFQLYSNPQGYFSKERLRLHARIAHQLYESTPQDLTFPRFVLLIGIPGAGKSTVLSHLDTVGQFALSDFVNFDVDEIIALLPEFYHAMLNIGLGNEPVDPSLAPDAKSAAIPGPHIRYQMCRDEARFILHKNLYSAIMCRKNIILHGSGKSFQTYAGILDQVIAAGFDPHIVCLDIPVDEAYDRVSKRSNGYGRDVPRTLIDFTASLITRNFRRLASRVPNAHLLDSQNMPPRLVWSKQRSTIVASDAIDPVQRKYEL